MYNEDQFVTDYGMGPEAAQIFQAIMPMIAIWFIFFSLIMLVTLGNYILRGIAILKMSEQRGLTNGWLGFIPYANNYQLGKVSGSIEFGNKTIKNTGLWLLLLPIFYGVVFMIGYAIAIVPFIIKIVSLGDYPAEQEIMSAMSLFMVGLFVFVIIIVVAQVILYLFRGLALHKIFAQHNTGQKPVFYVILAIFVPIMEGLLLFMNRNKPLIDDKAA